MEWSLQGTAYVNFSPDGLSDPILPRLCQRPIATSQSGLRRLLAHHLELDFFVRLSSPFALNEHLVVVLSLGLCTSTARYLKLVLYTILSMGARARAVPRR